MRVHTVVVASVLGMAASSALAWSVSSSGLPPSAKAAASATDTIAGDPVTGPAALGSKLAATTGPKANTEFELAGPLSMSGRIGHPTVPTGRTDDTFVFVNLAAQSDSFAETVTPANVTIVLDRSGSMRGSRMDTALAAARGMVSQLRDTDTVSVIAYDEDAQLVVAPTTLGGSRRASVFNALATIRAKGHTCVSCGVGRALALAPRSDSAVHRVLLLSDGKANRGSRTITEFSRIAQQARQTQSAVTSIGVGVDYDERLLASLSRGTNGTHHFVERLDQLAPIFQSELEAVSQSVAASATVDVTLAPGVEVLEVMDRASSRDGNRLVVPFGSFSAGEDKTLLMRVRLPARDAGVRTVGDVTLRYTDAATGRRERLDATLEVAVGQSKGALDPTVEARIAQSETIRDIEAVNELIAAGRDEEAERALRTSRARVKRRREAATSRGLLPSAPATASFEQQAQVLDLATKNAAETRQATRRGDTNAPKKRKAASKANAAAASPFN